MKALITLLFITCSMVVFGQSLPPGVSTTPPRVDTTNQKVIKVKPNALQLEQLQQFINHLQETQAQYERAIELIVGVRKEDIENIEKKDSLFIVKVKRKK